MSADLIEERIPASLRKHTAPISADVIKKRILAAFRRHTAVTKDGTMDWRDLCLVLQALDPVNCTDKYLQELRAAAADVIELPAVSPTRIMLEPFINWIFVDDEVKRMNDEAGCLAYPVSEADLRKAKSLVEQVRSNAKTDPVLRVQQVLRKLWTKSRTPEWPKRGRLKDTDRRLFLIYTDLEPDDIMFIAQLWEWKCETQKVDGEPLVIFHANFGSRDGGTILEKKQLLLSLFLGVSKYYILTKEGDTGEDLYKLDQSRHPQHQWIVDARNRLLDEICDELVAFGGSIIDFYIIAPGGGNLGAIIKRLKSKGQWPLKARWRVSLYSGSYNMRGMQPEDLEALREIMTTCTDEPLVDIGKYPFFDGANCHECTDSLTTFAMPSFAHDLARQCPVHASMLRLFNDEFNATLIDPANKSIFRTGVVWTPEEEARFERIKLIFDHRSASKLQEYAKRMWEDLGIREKLANYKRSTFKAYAYGACDSPLCDQLIFIYEFFTRRNDYLVIEEGYWHFNREMGFTEIKQSCDGKPGAFRTVRPKMARPKERRDLMEMSDVLQTYLMRHLYTLDCHVGKYSGLLVYTVPAEVTETFAKMVDEASKITSSVRETTDRNGYINVLERYVPDWRPLGNSPEGCDNKQLMFVYTDLEPDDAMSCAQLWEWKNETQNMNTAPLIVLGVNFKKKDGGHILEKKQLMANLMLGIPDYHILAPADDTTGQQVYEQDGTVHPHNAWMQRTRQAEIDIICEALVNSMAAVISFYVLAPGGGNLGDIVTRLMDKGQWPLPQKPKWHVKLYSGQYNMDGMTQRDIWALTEIMSQSDAPLVDVSKFVFFGGSNCHPWTDSLTTFASPHLSREISAKYPYLAAALKQFNDEFNCTLVNPITKDFFKKKPLTDEEKTRYEQYRSGFHCKEAETVQKFCKQVVEDPPIFEKLPGFKKSTFRSFASGGCDSPLCDQLVFAYECLESKRREALDLETGYWFFDRSVGSFTEIRPEEGRFPAVRPKLKNPHDEVVLTDLRKTLEHYLMQHLDVIKCKAEKARRAGSRAVD